MSFDEGVVCIELADAFLSQPLSDFHEFFLKRSFLFCAQMFNLNIAFIPEKLLNVIDGLSVNFVNVRAISLRSPKSHSIYISGKKC